MRSVTHEAAHFRLALLASFEEHLNLGEHRVQRDRKVTNLVAGVVVLNTLREVAGSNLSGGLLHASQRLEGAGHNHPGHRDGGGKSRQTKREGQHAHEGDHLVGLLQRHGNNQGCRLRQPGGIIRLDGHGEHAPIGGTTHRIDGDRLLVLLANLLFGPALQRRLAELFAVLGLERVQYVAVLIEQVQAVGAQGLFLIAGGAHGRQLHERGGAVLHLFVQLVHHLGAQSGNRHQARHRNGEGDEHGSDEHQLGAKGERLGNPVEGFKRHVSLENRESCSPHRAWCG